MDNLQALVLVTLVTNAPTTNWITPSGKEIEVVRLVQEQHVISYTNHDALIVRTNFEHQSLLVEKFILKEEWVRSPVPMLRPPPLPPTPANRRIP